VISINFASRNYRAIAWTVRGLTAFAVLLTVLAGILVWKSTVLRSDLAQVRQRIADAEAADEKIRPLMQEREQLVRNLNAMSGLLETRKFSWTRLFTSIEAAVPTGVAFTKIEFDPRTRVLSVQGTAFSPEALRNRVVGLERSSSFKDPVLKHQSIEKGSISFNVIATYVEQKAAAVAAGPR
jgi:Tfp pilus assembly protein PilN